MTALKIVPSTSAAISDDVVEHEERAPRKPKRGEFRLVKKPEYAYLVFIERRSWFWWVEVGFAGNVHEAKQKIATMKSPTPGKTVIEDGL